MRNFIALILLIVGFSACNNNHVVFDKYQTLDLQKWHKDSILKFTFEPVDTVSRHNIFVNIRNNNAYVYSNLFLIVGIEFPDQYTVIDTLEYEMADADGKFLGSGMTDLKENMLEYKPGLIFPKSGNYQIYVQHAMRKGGSVEGIEELDGISDVGIRIEKMIAND